MSGSCTSPARLARPRGFTLLELLVVMVILGLLASYVAPRYLSQVSRSEVQVAKAQMDALAKAIDQYRLDTGAFPSTELGLKALMQKPDGVTRWNGPYLQKDAPADPWGRPYIYRPSADGGAYELLTLGKDGRPGGDHENADISR
jgi:general secretion pathway protein G